ncbi:acyl-CoA dehydrogenase/oxidase C-terminal [Zopfochytrium polystomum]|nr:acyl-CoA dehydrogenase/oxidase C-terminal [Zopfochytrium polystomum]
MSQRDSSSNRIALVQRHLFAATATTITPSTVGLATTAAPSESGPIPPPNPMESIADERKNPSFPIRAMTHYLNEGEANTLIREKIMLQFERDPVFSVHDVYDQTLPEIREKTMVKVSKLAGFLASEPINQFRTRMEIMSAIDPATWTRCGVHFGLFFGAIQGQATPQQFSYWVQKGALALNGVIGCFGMTEMGHGSNVAGLETTATFDEAADEFVIHTPTLTATKWWIGGAAQSATHCAVFAQMVVKGKRFGVKTFIVQLRNPEDFSLRPGILIGDIGSKMGRHGIDNGWIQFTHVRVPRSHLLQKYTKVSRSGEVSEPPMAQLAYGALITGRVSMVVDSGNTAKKALTIALRYAAVRRQFGANAQHPETKLLDYVIHQHRLIPLLAQAFAMHFCGIEVRNMADSLTDRLNSLSAKDPDMPVILAGLKELHGTSAGLKAFCTWNTLDTIDKCRQSLGGHGYSSYTGLAAMYNDFAVQCTWEGDNTILALQSGRYLVGCYREAKQGKKQASGVGYLNNLPSILSKKCKARSLEEVADLESIAEAFWLVSANVVKKAGEDFESFLSQGHSEEQAYEECSQARLYAARLHSIGYLFHRFKDAVQKAPAELSDILTALARLYGLHSIDAYAGAFLQYGFYTSQHMDWIRTKINELCRVIRKQAVCLTDSFGFSDYFINSPFGRYDGNIYEHYFRAVQRKHEPGQVPEYFRRVTHPLLHRSVAEEEVLELDDEE